MKKLVIIAAMVLVAVLSQEALAHQMYIKQNPTNQTGIEFGVDNATGFVRWRAYVKGLSNNSQGLNSGWLYANGWWYYDISAVTQRVMWRLDGLVNQKFTVTYWVFKSDGTWEYGPQVEVISDQILPTASFASPTNGQTFTTNQFNVLVASSDNLSGVAATRIYAVVPSGFSLSGWTPSGLANQFYKEFGPSSISYNFVAPSPGAYTFTLWVKDNAGNIAYEPGGPITVNVNQENPPPQPTPPIAPSNLTLTANGQTIALAWQDNSSDEEGFGLYKNGQFVKNLPANTITYTDSGLQYGQSYCYNVYAFKAGLNSSGIESCLTLTAPPSTDYHYADSFTYPLACDKIYRLEKDTEIPTGACFDYQPYGSLFAYLDKIHQGADLNLKGINDLGKPVYAIANALVWDYGWTSGWGNYLILRIQANSGQYFYLTDSTKVNEIFVLYGHLNEIRIIKDTGAVIEKASIVKQGTYVAKGWQIGTVGDGNGNFSPHLHFEIRINGYSQLGNGYWPVSDQSYLNYFVDPLEFIDNNESLAKPALRISVHGYDLESSRKVNLSLDQNYWHRQGRESDGLPLAAVGWANHIWLSSSTNDTIASWNFYVPQNGAYSVYVVVPRYYGQASGVSYKVWHGSQNTANPYVAKINQANSDVNNKVYLGTFDYYQNNQYSVDLLSKTADNPAKNVALDSIVLTYEGDLGTGGGTVPPTDPPSSTEPLTINSSGTLTLRYSGTYSAPVLYCYGSGMPGSTPIFSGGIKEKTINVSQSGRVYCNIEFEDGQWLGNYQGIMPNQHLYVEDQEITYFEDNGQGGSNLIFDLVVNGDPGDSPPDVDDPSGTINFSGTINVPGLDQSAIKGAIGCQINRGGQVFNFTTLINLLVLFSPLLFLVMRRQKKSA